jgi:type IV pilus assembly protein PilM
VRYQQPLKTVLYSTISMSLFHKQEKIVGVDLGSDTIKLVELHKQKDRPQLWTYGLVHIPMPSAAETPEEKIHRLGTLLASAVRQAKVTASVAMASLPVSEVFHTVVTLPEGDVKTQDTIIRGEVRKLVSRSVEEMEIIHQTIPRGDDEKKRKYQRELVTVAPKELIALYTAIFQKAELRLMSLETEAFALSRSLVGKDGSPSVIVDVGNSRTNVFIVDQGIPMTHRSIHIGGKDIDAIIAKILHVDPQVGKHIKRDISATTSSEVLPEELFKSAFDPIVKEVQQSMDAFAHQTLGAKQPEKIILTGGAALFPPVASVLAKTFAVRVFVGDPWARVVYQDGLRPLLSDIGSRMSVPVGLALRLFTAS